MAYESKLKRDDIDQLFDAVLTLEDREDCYRFFEDICTINEIHAIAQRLQVAKLLSKKKTYSEIESITSASTATISRINKCLLYGADGYKRVLARLKGDEEEKAEDATDSVCQKDKKHRHFLRGCCGCAYYLCGFVADSSFQNPEL